MTPGFWGWGGGVGPTLPDLRVQTGVFAQAHFPSSVLKHSGGTWCFSVTLTTFGDEESFLAGQEVKSLTSFHTLVSYLLQRNSLPLSKISVDFGGARGPAPSQAACTPPSWRGPGVARAGRSGPDPLQPHQPCPHRTAGCRAGHTESRPQQPALGPQLGGSPTRSQGPPAVSQASPRNTGGDATVKDC